MSGRLHFPDQIHATSTIMNFPFDVLRVRGSQRKLRQAECVDFTGRGSAEVCRSVGRRRRSLSFSCRRLRPFPAPPQLQPALGEGRMMTPRRRRRRDRQLLAKRDVLALPVINACSTFTVKQSKERSRRKMNLVEVCLKRQTSES